MKKIAIAFACDNHYIAPLSVCIESLLRNRNDRYFYDIFILVPGVFLDKNIESFSIFERQHSKVKISFLNLANAFQDARMTIKHISHVTYFRFKLSELLPDYDRCLYLDDDIVVHDDISELFEIDLSDNLLGAVAHPGCYRKSKLGKKTIEQGKYFNAGVLLFNLKQIRKERKDQEWIKLMSCNLRTQDQGILNYSCMDRVKYLGEQYNWMTQLIDDPIMRVCKQFRIASGSDTPCERPKIIHFAGPNKPWQCKGLSYSDTFWDYAKTSPFAEELMLEYAKKKEYFQQKHRERYVKLSNEYDKKFPIVRQKLLAYRLLNLLTFGSIGGCKRKIDRYQESILTAEALTDYVQSYYVRSYERQESLKTQRAA